MSNWECYMFYQTGQVQEVMPSMTKAVITFEIHNDGMPQRALLFSKNFVHNNEQLTDIDPLQEVIRLGDVVTFHCHPLASNENVDFVQWLIVRAWKSTEDDEQLTITAKTGTVQELEPGKGVLNFDFYGVEECVYFIRSRYYHFGTRASSKQPLSNFIQLDDNVSFEATRCIPGVENKNCTWFAKVVYKGKKPFGPDLISIETINKSGMRFDESVKDSSYTADRSKGATADVSAPDTPTLGQTMKVSHLYKDFEAGGNVRDGPGEVIDVLGEESGTALWMTAPNCWETVFFHRTVAYLDDLCLSKYDLKESYCEGTHVHIVAVRASSDFPCRWIARKISVANYH